MSLLFKPNGTLDIATEATDLPEESGNGSSASEALARCKNVITDRKGRVDTRHGSSRPTSLKLTAIANFIIEQSGNRYSFAGDSIYKDEVSIVSSLTDAQWSAIKYNAFNDTIQRIFALNGTDRKKINGTTVEEWGIDPPTVVPTLAVGAGTGLTGDFNIKYTYAVKSGSTVITESNPSDAASSAQTLSNEDLKVTWTASTDSQVTHVRLYRTLSGGLIYFHDQDIAVGTVTIDTSTTDANLGGEVDTDHNRPPLGSVVIGPLYNGLCFIIQDNLLYWCKDKQPEYWPTNNFIEVGPPQFPGKTAISLDGQLYVLTRNILWFIQGTTSGAFKPIPFESLAGSLNIFAAIGVKGRGIYHLGQDGIYLFSGGVDRKVSEKGFEPIFPDTAGDSGTTTNGVALVPADNTTLWLRQYQNSIYFHWGEGNILATNLESNKTRYLKYDLRLSAPTVDVTNALFFVGDSGSHIRQIEDPSVTTDIGNGIDWEVQSKDFTLQTRSHFPRWAKYDVDIGTATNLKGEIILDDVIHQAHTLTVSRKTKQRLIKEGNGERAAIRISGTGPATVYMAEME